MPRRGHQYVHRSIQPPGKQTFNNMRQNEKATVTLLCSFTPVTPKKQDDKDQLPRGYDAAIPVT